MVTKTKRKPLPAGEYNTTITSIRNTGKPNEYAITFQIETEQAKGMKTYIVFQRQYRIYTTIGAKNIHHACNKATKTFKGNFDGIREKVIVGSFHDNMSGWQFKSVAEFNKLLNESENLTP